MEQATEFSTRLQNKYGYMGSDWKIDNTALLDGEVLRNISIYGVAGTILLVAGSFHLIRAESRFIRNLAL